MRYRLGDVVTHPTRIPDWWLELPARRRFWWRGVLFDEGAGWLKWKPAWREHVSYDPPDFEAWKVFPPLHRAWLAVTGWVIHPRLVLRGDVPWNGWPSLVDVRMLKDEDRKRLFK